MKITHDDLKSIKEEPIELFYQGIKAQATREKYTRTLRRILCDILEDVLSGSFEERASQLVSKSRNNPEWIMSILLSISRKLKERTTLDKDDSNYFNPVSIPNYFKPLKKLLDMNDIPVVWDRVYATYPEMDNLNSDSRGYTRKEIKKMLGHTNGAIDKAIILIAASSGIREGGFENLKWKDVMPIYKVGDELKTEITELEKADIVCAVITIYRGSSHEYPALITREAYDALQAYKIEWERDIGKPPKPTDVLFKRAGAFEIALKPTAIKQRVLRILKDSGIRLPLPKGRRRHDVPVMNGFRRFFNKVNKETISKDSPLAALIKKEFMMEHTGLIKLDKNYFKTHLLELVEEYLHAAPNLTISNEERYKSENLELRKKHSDAEQRAELLMNYKEKVDTVEAKLKNQYQNGLKFMDMMFGMAQKIEKMGIGDKKEFQEIKEQYDKLNELEETKELRKN